MVEQTFDNRAVRNLNRHLNQLRLRLCKFEDPAAMQITMSLTPWLQSRLMSRSSSGIKVSQ